MSLARTLRGRLLVPDPTQPGWTELPDAIIEIDDCGNISSVAPADPADPRPETWPGTVLMPGLVDSHLHFPQTRMVGTAAGPLLEWLSTTTFPEEARFADDGYATAVADEFCAALARAGTTLSSVYGSPHPSSTHILFDALHRSGLRAQAGLTLMDRGAPPANLLGEADAVEACRALVQRWHGADDGRLKFILTPRFAIACSADMLHATAKLADELDLRVQTHISENADEITTTASLFPASADYLGVYEDHGLLLPGTILAHCVHLSPSEWDRLKAAGAVVSHCPDSNFFLGSGVMPLAKALAHGAIVALGSDIGGGRTFCMRRVAARAFDAALMVGERVTPQTLLWLATRGGAIALGKGSRTGALAPGFAADLVAVDVPAQAAGSTFDHLLFNEDHGAVRATLVSGRTVWERPA
jgi:guanine deaminase